MSFFIDSGIIQKKEMDYIPFFNISLLNKNSYGHVHIITN